MWSSKDLSFVKDCWQISQSIAISLPLCMCRVLTCLLAFCMLVNVFSHTTHLIQESDTSIKVSIMPGTLRNWCFVCREANNSQTVKLEAISDDTFLFLMHSCHVNTESIFRSNSFFTQVTRVTENIGKVNSLYMVSHIITRSKSKLFTNLAEIFLSSWIIRNILV